jgi:hypothetical protein
MRRRKMLPGSVPITCLAGVVAKAKAVERDRLKRAKEDAHRLIGNGATDQELIKQTITYLSLFPSDQEAKLLVAQLAPKPT